MQYSIHITRKVAHIVTWEYETVLHVHINKKLIKLPSKQIMHV